MRLTQQHAEKFLAGELKRLHEFTILDDAAAEALAKYKGILHLRGLKTLSDAAAEALARHEHGLNFNGLTTISDAVAEALAKHKGNLSLDGLETLSDAAAEALAKHKGDLSLRGLWAFSDSAAEAFAKHKADLTSYGLEFISNALVKAEGWEYDKKRRRFNRKGDANLELVKLLPELKLPKFVVLHNSTCFYEQIWEASQLDGKVAGIADTFAEAEGLVPRPTIPNYSGSFVTDSNIPGPSRNPENDIKRFGETYTIVWIAPGAVDVAVAALMQEVKRLQGDVPEADWVIGSCELLELNRQVVDRMFIYFPNPVVTANVCEENLPPRLAHYREVSLEFERQLSALPNGPTPEDWDEYYELDEK